MITSAMEPLSAARNESLLLLSKMMKRFTPSSEWNSTHSRTYLASFLTMVHIAICVVIIMEGLV